MNKVSHEKQIEVLDAYPIDGLDPEQFELASKIAANWHRLATTIIETAKLLGQVEQLPKLEKKKVKAHLMKHAGMSKSVISKLAKIANSDALTLEHNIPRLPPSYNTLYLLADKSDDELTEAIANGDIHPKLERKDVADVFPEDLREIKRRAADRQKRNEQASPTIKLAFTGNFAAVPPDKLKALSDICEELKHFGVKTNLNTVNKVG